MSALVAGVKPELNAQEFEQFLRLARQAAHSKRLIWLYTSHYIIVLTTNMTGR